MQLRPIPRLLVVLILAIAIVNALALQYSWYWLMRWFDMPMHFAGGVWLAGVALWWRFFSGKFPEDGPRGTVISFAPLLLWGVGTALGIGLAWEGYEALISVISGEDINAMMDTLSDLCFDMFGGLVVASVVWIRRDKFN